MKKKSSHHPTYSAILDNDDKVPISHISHVSNPTSSVKNLSVYIKVALLHIRCAGSWDASVLRDGNLTFNLTWPVTCNSATLWTHRPAAQWAVSSVPPRRWRQNTLLCLQLVHTICSASDKFRFMTVKLLYFFSDKADVLKVKYFPHFKCYQCLTTKHIQQLPKLCVGRTF